MYREVSNKIVFLFLRTVFILANSVDPDEIPHCAAFHLVSLLFAKARIHLGVTSIQRVN